MRNFIFRKHFYSNTFLLQLVLIVTGLCGGQTLSGQNLSISNESYQMEISEKGDLKLLAIRTQWTNQYSNRLNQSDVNTRGRVAIGFSPIQRLSLIGSFNQENGNKNESLANWIARKYEFAIGTYHVFNRKDKDKGYVKVDLFVGQGWGNRKDLFFNASDWNLSYDRRFIHGGVHLCLGPYFTFSGGYRFMDLRYKTIKARGPIPISMNNRLDEVIESNPSNLVEVSYQLKAGPEVFKFFVARTSTRRAKPLGDKIYHFPAINNLGIVVDIDSIYRK